jgi:hypothetical protein
MSELERLDPRILKPHIGEWVIVCKGKIVAHNKDLSKIYGKVATCKTTPLVMCVPEEKTWIF